MARRTRLLPVTLLVLAAVARAQEPTPPPLPTMEPLQDQPSSAPVEPVQQQPSYAPVSQPVQQPPPTYAQQCFGYPSGMYLLPLPRVSTGLAVSGSTSRSGNGGNGSSSSGSSGSASGGGDGKALLVIAVLVAIALPVVIYAFDDEAAPIVQQRFGCPSFHLDLQGGADTGVAFPGARPFGQGRFTMAFGYFGTDVQGDFSPAAVSTFAAHALLRIFPRQHVEGALSAGYRRMVVGGQVRDGFDVGLPHRYAFWRDDLRMLGLELRPSLQFGPAGIDAALEAAFIAPVFELLHLRLGGRVFSYGSAIVFGGTAGLTLGI
ncbi:MAG: hypothetical protein GQE15_42500 [Archangiaceae bacterium]|nr:hypothetical protein [Archangiaceae bacterium]